MIRRRWWAALAVAAWTILPAAAQAHDDLVTGVDIEVNGARVAVTIAVPADALSRALGGVGADDSAVARALGAGLSVAADDRAAAPPTVAPAGPEAARVARTFVFDARVAPQRLRVTLDPLATLGGARRIVVRVRWDDRERRLVEDAPATLSLRRGQGTSSGGVALEFVGWGLVHIFRGWDHLAFLLALLLGVTRLRALLAIVTSFTVAHSTTLLLASLHLVRVPARAAEALIAFSIVYVAVENLGWGLPVLRPRWLLTFAFGLAHGLGFATQLRERLGELPGPVLLPVLAFNVGVELGQIAFVAAVFPALAWLRRARTPHAAALQQRRLARVGSVPILLVGLYWLVDRLVG